jgi:hypothetical protein
MPISAARRSRGVNIFLYAKSKKKPMATNKTPAPEHKQATITMDANTSIQFLGQDVDWWNGALLATLAFAALAAATVVVSTAGVIVSQKRQSAADAVALEKYKLDAARDIASANAAGSAAKTEAAQATERARQLEKDAASARLETEQLKATVSWRTIKSPEAEALRSILSEKPGTVNLRYTDGDPEALFLAIQIEQILHASHWQVAPGAIKPANAIVFGIHLPDADTAAAATLRRAFSEAHVPFSPSPVPDGPQFSVANIDGAPMLMVGSRPPPQFP